ncbi:hypothetical protein GW17_00014956 [Ensete ventricosum]|nr:hypothetical protein GW17_00014956 [Ensete ventricosum]RZS26246.1 hypothetical protein BHM03_00059565 [Ensete ventricosum]
MPKIRLCFSIPRGSRDLARRKRQINRKMKPSISKRAGKEKGPFFTVPLVLALRRHEALRPAGTRFGEADRRGKGERAETEPMVAEAVQKIWD